MHSLHGCWHTPHAPPAQRCEAACGYSALVLYTCKDKGAGEGLTGKGDRGTGTTARSGALASTHNLRTWPGEENGHNGQGKPMKHRCLYVTARIKARPDALRSGAAGPRRVHPQAYRLCALAGGTVAGTTLNAHRARAAVHRTTSTAGSQHQMSCAEHVRAGGKSECQDPQVRRQPPTNTQYDLCSIKS